jgi:hypothetical protein
MIVRRDGAVARPYSRNANDWTARLAAIDNVRNPTRFVAQRERRENYPPISVRHAHPHTAIFWICQRCGTDSRGETYYVPSLRSAAAIIAGNSHASWNGCSLRPEPCRAASGRRIRKPSIVVDQTLRLVERKPPSIVEATHLRKGRLLMKVKFVLAVIIAALAAPVAAHAQGIIGGSQEGVATGQQIAGPIGAVVGGVVGGVVGRVVGDVTGVVSGVANVVGVPQRL